MCSQYRVCRGEERDKVGQPGVRSLFDHHKPGKRVHVHVHVQCMCMCMCVGCVGVCVRVSMCVSATQSNLTPAWVGLRWRNLP